MLNCKRSPNSAEIIGGNDDLLTEFLTLIPAKQVIRLKLVSKQWKSLISTPTFCQRHTRRHHHPKPPPQVPSFFLRLNLPKDVYCYYQPLCKRLTPFRFTIPFPFVRVMQYCNGLFLLEAKTKPSGRNDYFVCNPTTMQYRDLLIGSCVDQNLSLVFDPLISSHYKVIRLMAKGLPRVPGREYTIDVYESETRTWKNNMGKHCTDNWLFHTVVYWNGGLYLIRPDGNSYCFNLQDIAAGRVNELVVDRPPKVPGKVRRRTNYVVVSNGRMHCISLSLQTKNKYVYVHELNKDDHTWSEKFRVDISPIAHVFADEYPRGGVVLGFVRGDKDEDSSFVFHQPGKILLYRLNNKRSLEVLADYRTGRYTYIEEQTQFDCNVFYEFNETLAPV